MGRLDGKVALISGGARGMGAVEAKLFALEGARVVFGDILDQEGERVEAQIKELRGEATYLHLDVTKAQDWKRAVDLVENKYGKLDILVNNAAIGGGGNIEDQSEEEWDKVMAVNAKGVFLGTKYAIPAMRRAGGGSIVNISSIAGLSGSSTGAYSASKGAIRSFTKGTAIHQAKDKIRCNSVHPGPIDTWAAKQTPQQAALVPLGRLGTSEDVAYGVLYLASDESSFVTAAELVIDGGITEQVRPIRSWTPPRPAL